MGLSPIAERTDKTKVDFIYDTLVIKVHIIVRVYKFYREY